MYKENEKLILLQNVGIKGKKNFIEKGSEVTFIKAIDNKNDLAKALLVVQHDDRQFALPELALKPKKAEKRMISALKGFNSALMDANPELRLYHHNPVMRLYYKVITVLHNIIIQPLKNLKHNLTTVPKSDKTKEEDLVNEIKKLMEK